MSSTDSGSSAEHDALCEFLGYQREALIDRLNGLSDEQARSTPTASALSLLGLVRHSAVWERRWFQVIVAGRRLPGEWPEVAQANVGRLCPMLQAYLTPKSAHTFDLAVSW